MTWPDPATEDHSLTDGQMVRKMGNTKPFSDHRARAQALDANQFKKLVFHVKQSNKRYHTCVMDSSEVSNSGARNGSEWYATFPRVPGIEDEPDSEPSEGYLPWGSTPRDEDCDEEASVVLRAENYEGGVSDIDRICYVLYKCRISFNFVDSWMECVRVPARGYFRVRGYLERALRLVCRPYICYETPRASAIAAASGSRSIGNRRQ